MVPAAIRNADSITRGQWPVVDIVRVGHEPWCVVFGRGRERNRDNHIDTACCRRVLVTTPLIEIVHNAALYDRLRFPRPLGDRGEVCGGCRPAHVAPEQLDLALGASP